MFGMVCQLKDALQWHENRESFWNEITIEIKSRFFWNTAYVGALLLVAVIWHAVVLSVDVRAFGILLVGMGAVKLAHVSARAHIGEFFETTHIIEAADRDITMNAYPRIAGNVVDVLCGFLLVAVGFVIRVGADFTGL